MTEVKETATNKNENAVTRFFWGNRNPMQKTANLGVIGGVALGAAGTNPGVLAALVFGLPVFYNSQTAHKGAKKVGLCVAAGAMTIFTAAFGAAIGSSITGREMAETTASSNQSKPALSVSSASTVTSTASETPFQTQQPANPQAAQPRKLPFTPSVAPPKPSTDNPILLKRWEERVAEVEIENNPELMNQPRNGGSTTLAQKCEARAAGGDLSDSFNIGFQIGFEHETGDLSTDEACRRVRLAGLQ